MYSSNVGRLQMRPRAVPPPPLVVVLLLVLLLLHWQTDQSCSRTLTINRMEALYEAMRADGYRLDTRTLFAVDHMCRVGLRPDVASRLRRERSTTVWTGSKADSHER